MSMSSAVSSVLRQYVTFSGRARRSEFWWWYLAVFLVAIVFAIAAYLFGAGTVGTLLALGYSAFGLLILLPTVAVAVRRLHDRGMPAWWLLLIFVPAVGELALLILLALPGQPGTNRYGPPA